MVLRGPSGPGNTYYLPRRGKGYPQGIVVALSLCSRGVAPAGALFGGPSARIIAQPLRGWLTALRAGYPPGGPSGRLHKHCAPDGLWCRLFLNVSCCAPEGESFF